jgi:hypothetical protein
VTTQGAFLKKFKFNSKLNRKREDQRKRFYSKFYDNPKKFELWDLGFDFLRFIIPRLELFAKNTNSWPSYRFSKFEDWQNAINKMIIAFKLLASLDDNEDDNRRKEAGIEYKKFTESKTGKIAEGLQLFSENILSLWW